MKRAFERMKSRWGVGPLGVVAILATFSLAGSTVVYLGHPVMDLVLPSEVPTPLRVPLYLIIMFPLYQVLLLAYATLLGKLRFFWEKEKRLYFLLRRAVVGVRRG